MNFKLHPKKIKAGKYFAIRDIELMYGNETTTPLPADTILLVSDGTTISDDESERETVMVEYSGKFALVFVEDILPYTPSGIIAKRLIKNEKR